MVSDQDDGGWRSVATSDRPTHTPFPTVSEWKDVEFNAGDFLRLSDLFEKAKASADSESIEHAITKAARLAAVDTGAIEGLYEVDRGFPSRSP